jgi:hypothetical protein
MGRTSVVLSLLDMAYTRNTSVRLSEESLNRLEELKSWLGCNQSRAIDQAINHTLVSLKREGHIWVPEPPAGGTTARPATSSPPLRVVAKPPAEKRKRQAR